MRSNALGDFDRLSYRVRSNRFQSINTGCIKSIAIDATGCDRSTLVLKIIAVVAENRMLLLRSCDCLDVACDRRRWHGQSFLFLVILTGVTIT
jgi:hypothetical protein